MAGAPPGCRSTRPPATWQWRSVGGALGHAALARPDHGPAEDDPPGRCPPLGGTHRPALGEGPKHDGGLVASDLT
jgi:hypothetical protein